MPYNAHPFIPRGIVAIFTGLLANIPVGWAICDGNGGTPNLLSRFMKSVTTNAEDPGSTGGSNSHTHIADSHVHTNPGHSHGCGGASSGADSNKSSLQVSLAVKDHTHPVSANSDSVGSATPTVDLSTEIPPYYQVAYMMKL